MVQVVLVWSRGWRRKQHPGQGMAFAAAVRAAPGVVAAQTWLAGWLACWLCGWITGSRCESVLSA